MISDLGLLSFPRSACPQEVGAGIQRRPRTSYTQFWHRFVSPASLPELAPLVPTYSLNRKFQYFQLIQLFQLGRVYLR
jgi:hypothetical protein